MKAGEIAARVIRRLGVIKYNLTSIGAKKVFLQMRAEMLAEAADFLIEKKLINSAAEVSQQGDRWSGLVKSLFDPSNPEAFYTGWTGKTGSAGIIANVNDQFGRYYMYKALALSLGLNNSFKGTVLDFGCGTGALSLSWQRKYCNEARLYLADVENLSAEFVRYQRGKHPESKIEQTGISLESLNENSMDVLICAHVLEHLKNPSEVFATIEAKLKNNGLLILDAPWGGHPEHLAEAPIDWENNGGAAMLKDKYVKVKGLNPYPGLSGVFRKK